MNQIYVTLRSTKYSNVWQRRMIQSKYEKQNSENICKILWNSRSYYRVHFNTILFSFLQRL